MTEWYIAESRDSVIRYTHGVSHGRRSEGYELAYGAVFMHLVEMEPAEIASLTRLVTEEGDVSVRLALPGEKRWWFSKGGKARWPGTKVHSRFSVIEGAKWAPASLDEATVQKLRDAP